MGETKEGDWQAHNVLLLPPVLLRWVMQEPSGEEEKTKDSRLWPGSLEEEEEEEATATERERERERRG